MRYLALNYPNSNLEPLSAKELDESKRKYMGISRIQLETFQNLYFWLQRAFPEAIAAYPRETLVLSYQSAVDLYESNRVYAYPVIIENAHKSLNRLKGMN